jgi:hypothetical protein
MIWMSVGGLICRSVLPDVGSNGGVVYLVSKVGTILILLNSLLGCSVGRKADDDMGDGSLLDACTFPN